MNGNRRSQVPAAKVLMRRIIGRTLTANQRRTAFSRPMTPGKIGEDRHRDRARINRGSDWERVRMPKRFTPRYEGSAKYRGVGTAEPSRHPVRSVYP